MKTPDEVAKFGKYKTSALMSKIEQSGGYTVASELRGMGYAINNGAIGVFAGIDGAMRIDIDKARKFISEFSEIVELAEYRKRMGVKNA